MDIDEAAKKAISDHWHELLRMRITKIDSSMNETTLNDYQSLAQRTAQPDWSQRERLTMAALGLTGEAGEVADHLKKVYFHGHAMNEEHLVKELGDILWYLAEAATALGVTLEYIAACNIEKLDRRYPDGFDPKRSQERAE